MRREATQLFNKARTIQSIHFVFQREYSYILKCNPLSPWLRHYYFSRFVYKENYF